MIRNGNLERNQIMHGSHSWKFFRAGGFDQVRLDSGGALMALDQLDQKLWVALACPTQGLEFDAKTLALIDLDKDGRIRAPEIIAAAKWTCACLKNPSDLLKSAPALPLSAINADTPEGAQLLASAKQILVNLGKTDAPAISVEDTADTVKIFAQTNFNGDGIVPADAAEDPAVKSIITDIIECLGADTDRSGKPGISQARADQFFTEAQAWFDWWKRTEADAAIVPLGEATPGAAAALKAVKGKVDDYFVRCRLAAFDPRAVAALNREEKEYLAITARDLTIAAPEIAALPLARVEAGKPLPLKDGVNPAWADAMSKLQSDVVKPLLGDKSTLTETEWNTLAGKFAAYEAWTASKAGAAVEKLGLKRIREILEGKGKEAIAALIAKDKALEPEANAIAAVDKLVRYYRDLYKLLNNFVSFRDFYGRKEKAIFQAGTLYLDQRSCDLCLTVEDAGRHATMAGLAGSYLAYCDCVRKATGEKRQIVAAFTDGDSDNLMVGRNGIFYDRRGADWDATIVKIIDNPISIRQAFWSPYKKFVRLVEEQVAKRAALADAAANAQLAQTAQSAAELDKAPPPPPPAKPKVDTGTLAAIGLVLTTLLSALGGIFGRILGLSWWQIPLAFIAIILAISAPSVIMAFLKLRRRNLGPILDANGWAVNAKAKLNVPFGRSLTQVAALPPGAQRDLTDQFAEKKTFRNWAIAILIIVVAAILWFRIARPVIGTEPQNSTVTAGGAATFNASARSRGGAPLNYQWHFNGAKLANGGRINGATASSLSISGVLPADAGNYALVASTVAGSVTSAVATLTVTTPISTNAASSPNAVMPEKPAGK